MSVVIEGFDKAFEVTVRWSIDRHITQAEHQAIVGCKARVPITTEYDAIVGSIAVSFDGLLTKFRGAMLTVVKKGQPSTGDSVYMP